MLLTIKVGECKQDAHGVFYDFVDKVTITQSGGSPPIIEIDPDKFLYVVVTDVPNILPPEPYPFRIYREYYGTIDLFSGNVNTSNILNIRFVYPAADVCRGIPSDATIKLGVVIGYGQEVDCYLKFVSPAAHGTITGVTYPTTAQAPGTIIGIGVNFKNVGAVAGTFKVRFSSTIKQVETLNISLDPNATMNVPYGFVMPTTNVSINIQLIRII